MEVLTSATNAAGSSAIRTGEVQASPPTLTAGEKLAAYYDLT
jgi:hypothetical protein